MGKLTESILEKIKKDYGLVPARNESTEDFEKRAYETIHRKDKSAEKKGSKMYLGANSIKGFIYKFLKIMNPGKGMRNITSEVQSITNRYLGIKSESIDAFETENPVFAKGFTYNGNDGASFVVAKDMKDNRESMVNKAADSLEKIVDGRPVSADISNLNYSRYYIGAGFSNKSDLHNMYCELCDMAFNNETFVRLHEGIHAIHVSNTSYGRRKEKQEDNELKSVQLKSLLQLTPLIGSIPKAKRLNFSIETETLAYKVGLDEYMDELLLNAADVIKVRHGKIKDEKLKDIREKFREMNSGFSKIVIREAYLKNPLTGCGTYYDNYKKLLIDSLMGPILFSSDNMFVKSLGAIYLIDAADSILDMPMALCLQNKINRTVNTVHALAKKYNGAGKAFNKTLGMSFREMAKDAKSKINYSAEKK